MDTAVRNACISGDLPTAEELLTQEIDVNGDSYRSYANRSVVMARRLDWDNALRNATKSLSIQPSLMGYISKGIALFGIKQIRDATQAFDLAFTFSFLTYTTLHYTGFQAIALFHANKHADAMRRIRELTAACPDGDTNLACRVIEVYLHIQLGNNALDRACPAEAVDHFTSAVNAGTFLTKSVIHSKYDDFVVLFGCDFTSLWQTANQKRCRALLRAGRLVEVFEACRYMADMSDETMKASCLDWTIGKCSAMSPRFLSSSYFTHPGFMQELSTLRDHAPNADATPDMCKYDDENDSISDVDSDIDRVDDSVC
ncbi:hypothetical protein K503DRAFT_795868 [Rhizopogon vinicolor AM-OR11-026]|uniref:TPR-like protein n=1 Tax=Rhizopogon vinicolor AM-OR11-026 TaxID=1314800 RepID=A0A1B7NG90_9AGAM|nr:hypothetical protein K503DRAFT_795868 [Rhizopogon vinicolor AM-OR11-026]